MHDICLRKWVHALLICPGSKRAGSLPDFGQGEGRIEMDVRDSVVQQWLGVYDDIHSSFLRESTLVAFSLMTVTLFTRLREKIIIAIESIHGVASSYSAESSLNFGARLNHARRIPRRSEVDG